MSIERLIEAIGLPASELRAYLLAEIDEFLAAASSETKDEEFGDVLFALAATAWAHAGKHYPLDTSLFEPKVRERLRRYGTLSRKPPRFLDDRIPELAFGVVHLAFGQFEGQWQRFDALKNGTVAEISLLTDAPFPSPDVQANHAIITFDDVSAIEYDIIHAAPDTSGGNTLLCRIPDFLFKPAKRALELEQVGAYLSLQVLAALDGIGVPARWILHVHSWENGFLFDSPEFAARVAAAEKLFSPYLTVGPLKALVERTGGSGWTMTAEEMDVAARYEKALSAACDRLVLESERDRSFYGAWAPPERIDVRSFAGANRAVYSSAPANPARLTFIAGGRPVREKGFVELCAEFASVRDWASRRGIEATLAILCRERRREKGRDYIEEIERRIADLGLGDAVAVEPKVSLELLKRRIGAASAVITPSVYDPFCLLPTYAVEVERPAFVSVHAGVSENVASRGFTFDPLRSGDLVRAVSWWCDERPEFVYESKFPTYKALYLTGEGPWA